MGDPPLTHGPVPGVRSPDGGPDRMTGADRRIGSVSHRSTFLQVVITLAAIGLSMTLLRDLASIIAPDIPGAEPRDRGLPALSAPRPRGGAAGRVGGDRADHRLGVLAAFVWGITYSITAMVTQLSSYSDQFVNLYHQALDALIRLGFTEDMLLGRLKSLDPNGLLSLATSVLANAQGWLSLLTMLLLVDAVHRDGLAGRPRAARRRPPHPSLVHRRASTTSPRASGATGSSPPCSA